jgi:hypothetical protein
VCTALQDHNTASHGYTCGVWHLLLLMAHAQILCCISRIDRHVDRQSFPLSSDRCCALSSHHAGCSASEKITALHGCSSTWGLWLLCKLVADSLHMEQPLDCILATLCARLPGYCVGGLSRDTRSAVLLCVVFSLLFVWLHHVCELNQCACFTCTQAQRMNKAPCECEMCYRRGGA